MPRLSTVLTFVSALGSIAFLPIAASAQVFVSTPPLAVQLAGGNSGPVAVTTGTLTVALASSGGRSA